MGIKDSPFCESEYSTLGGITGYSFLIIRIVGNASCVIKEFKRGAILIMAGAGNGFEESKYWFNGMLKHMEWDNLGEILVGGVHNIGDIKERTEELQKAYELGKSIK